MSRLEVDSQYPSHSNPADGRIRLKLTAELMEDAHPGSGAGGDGLDALVARDRNGRPVIWSSHLKGLLRDAARRLWGVEAAEDLFGQQGRERQRVLCTSLYTAANPETHVWRSTARVSFDNRAPKDDTLRAVEYVPQGTRFEGQVEAPADAIERLHRLVREVDTIGHGRATGAGRIQLTLGESVASHRQIGTPTERLLLLLRNLDPLTVTATAMPGNLVPSFPHIPGRTLLGALAGWLIGEGNPQAASLLVGGHVSVSDALPLSVEPPQLSEAEVLPAPLSLRSEKPMGQGVALPWWALPARPVHRYDVLQAKEEERGQLKRPEPDLFVYRHSPQAPWEAFRPFLRVRLRNGRPQDPRQPDPMLFAVEQIAEETLFLSELRGALANMEQLSQALQPVLEGSRWLRVGRGGAPVEVKRLQWSQPQPPLPLMGPAYLILTSDLLARDSYLRWRTALNNAAFQELPGWPRGVTVEPVVQDTAPVHGFNGTSRLWRLPASSIRRGSVFRVTGEAVSELAEAAAEGRWLGERTHEGFGRFRLDRELPGVSPDDPATTDSTMSASQRFDDRSEIIAAVTRGWFESHRCLAEPGSGSDRQPSLSQWQDLVADLERQAPDAFSSRLQPRTAGKRVWRNQGAQEVLKQLEQIQSHEGRVEHARLFVRWLRAAMRRRRS